jgi:diketogulonate reductase-like aldo/keto reductase
MHWPIAFKKEPKADGSPIVDFELTENPYLTWKAMEELVDTGKVRNIGISK